MNADTKVEKMLGGTPGVRAGRGGVAAGVGVAPGIDHSVGLRAYDLGVHRRLHGNRKVGGIVDEAAVEQFGRAAEVAAAGEDFLQGAVGSLQAGVLTTPAKVAIFQLVLSQQQVAAQLSLQDRASHFCAQLKQSSSLDLP